MNQSSASRLPASDAGPGAGSVDGERVPRSNGERLTQLLAQFNGDEGYRAYVERIERDGTPVYLGALPFTESLYDDVKAKWGGGKFAARIMDSRHKYAARVPPFVIGGRPRDDEPEPVNVPRIEAPAASAPHVETTAVLTVLEGITKTLERMQTAFLERESPTDQLVKLATVIKTVTPAITGAPAASSPSEMIGLMREMMQFQREVSEDRPTAPASGMGALVEGGVKPLVQVLNRKLQLDEQRLKDRAAARSLPALPVNRVATVLADAAPARDTVDAGASENAYDNLDMTDPLVVLLAQIPLSARTFLLACAVDDDEPDDYVGMVLNRLSDDAYGELHELLKRPDFVDVLVAVVPKYADYREWFTRLVDGMRASLEVGEDRRSTLATEGVTGENAAAQTGPASSSTNGAHA